MKHQVDQVIEVSWVPPHQIGAAIQVFGYYLLRGLQAADLSLEDLSTRLVEGRAHLGVAYKVAPLKPMGIWVSDLHETDDGLKYATLYALAGERLPSWISEVEKVVVDWAASVGCHSVRFYGRTAYMSLIKGLNVLNKTEDGRAVLFEKRIA